MRDSRDRSYFFAVGSIRGGSSMNPTVERFFTAEEFK